MHGFVHLYRKYKFIANAWISGRSLFNCLHFWEELLTQFGHQPILQRNPVLSQDNNLPSNSIFPIVIQFLQLTETIHSISLGASIVTRLEVANIALRKQSSLYVMAQWQSTMADANLKSHFCGCSTKGVSEGRLACRWHTSTCHHSATSSRNLDDTLVLLLQLARFREPLQSVSVPGLLKMPP